MSLNQGIIKRHEEMKLWRRELHRHPELAFEEHWTSSFVAEKLKGFGLKVDRGLAGTGVVATLTQGEGPSIGLRADMDALPIHEKNNFEHCSQNPGNMHACGHDGHTAMLLGAAAELSLSSSFCGTVQFIFQPAEEGKGGGNVMVQEGLFERFPVDSVYGMHNWPGMEPGFIGVGAGPLLAATDTFDLEVWGRGGHAGMPNLSADPVAAAAQLICALQTTVSRNTNPLESVVLSVTQIHGGDTYNVIPDSVKLCGTIRTFQKEIREKFIENIQRVAEGVCRGLGVKSIFTIHPGYPATINTEEESRRSASAATKVVGAEKLIRNPQPSMVAEDFAYMLQVRPGCYVMLGNGAREGGCLLHNAHYDFNDEILPIGASYWIALVEQELPQG